MSKPYSYSEEMQILQFIIENKSYNSLRGNAVWKSIAQTNHISRTWQSMKERFRKHIITNINKYDLPDIEKTNINKGYMRSARTLQGNREVKPALSIPTSSTSREDPIDSKGQDNTGESKSLKCSSESDNEATCSGIKVTHIYASLDSDIQAEHNTFDSQETVVDDKQTCKKDFNIKELKSSKNDIQNNESNRCKKERKDSSSSGSVELIRPASDISEKHNSKADEIILNIDNQCLKFILIKDSSTFFLHSEQFNVIKEINKKYNGSVTKDLYQSELLTKFEKAEKKYGTLKEPPNKEILNDNDETQKQANKSEIKVRLQEGSVLNNCEIKEQTGIVIQELVYDKMKNILKENQNMNFELQDSDGKTNDNGKIETTKKIIETTNHEKESDETKDKLTNTSEQQVQDNISEATSQVNEEENKCTEPNNDDTLAMKPCENEIVIELENIETENVGLSYAPENVISEEERISENTSSEDIISESEEENEENTEE